MDFDVLPPEQKDDDSKVSRMLAYFLDDLIPIPGTKHRIGLDPIIGLIPGIGDSSTAVFSSMIIVNGLRAGVPRIVLLRMVGNVLINTLLGAFPVLGDIFSAWFKSNNRNYALLQKHQGSRRKASAGDWGVVIAMLIVLLLFVFAISILVGWIAVRFFTWLTQLGP
ncbi:MAG: DUF4112 domain-containing protein [Chthoniobacterales bacterium]